MTELERYERLSALLAFSIVGFGAGDEKFMSQPNIDGINHLNNLVESWRNSPGIEPWLVVAKQLASKMDSVVPGEGS